MADDWTVTSEATAQPNAWEIAGEKPAEPMGWGDTLYSAATNVPSSAMKFAEDTIHPFLHPIETYESIKNLGMGLLQKGGIVSGDDYEKYADAVGQFLVDRYGSVEAAKKTLANDPVGLAADLSLILTGGGAAAARAPGVMGTMGQAVRTAGHVIDPLTTVGLAAKGSGAVLSEVVGGLGTHTGGKPLRIAAEAGAEGGDAAKAFLENLRGTAPAVETVDAARKGLMNMIQQRGDSYRRRMTELGLDRTVLDFSKIDDALIEATKVKTFHGQDLSPSTTTIRSNMAQAIQEWKYLNPDTFHTPEGLDALKRKLGDMMEGTQPGSPEFKAAKTIYDGVRQTIIDQAPQYRQIMEAYEEASDIIKQMEKTLSLNPNASIDTSLRKLQSTLRNNVTAAYGHRTELAKFLVDAGAPHLMQRLAGQSLQPWLARGLGRLGMEVGAFLHPTIAGAAMGGLFSPRVMGETAYYTGKFSPYVPKVARPSFQTGRISQIAPMAGTGLEGSVYNSDLDRAVSR